MTPRIEFFRSQIVQRNIRNRQKFYYKEIARTIIGKNKHLVLSLRSDNRLSIAQLVNAETDDEVIDMHFRNAVSLFRYNIVGVLHALIYIVVRLPKSDIAPEDLAFIEELKRISSEAQNRFIRNAKQMGYPPAYFSGEAYDQFNQMQTGQGQSEFY